MSLYSRFIESRYLKVRYILALGLFVAASSGFASLADEVRNGDTLPFDRYILNWIYENISNPMLDTVISIGTNTGGVMFLVVTCAAATVLLVAKKAYSKALFLGLVMAGTGATNTVLKLFFERQRPDLWQQIVEETTFSFPSGHAMGSMAFGLTLVLLTWHTKWRGIVVLFATLYVLFIGFSRLYLGVHYPTDIAAGWLLAAAWVGILYSLLKVQGQNRSVTGEIPERKEA